MHNTEEKLMKRVIQAYKDKRFDYVKTKIKQLTENEKLEILYQAFMDGENILLTKENIDFLKENFGKISMNNQIEIICQAFINENSEFLSEENLCLLEKQINLLPEDMRLAVVYQAFVKGEKHFLATENVKYLKNNLEKIQGEKRLNVIYRAIADENLYLLNKKSIEFLGNNWRRLNGKERLDIIFHAPKIGIPSFSQVSHFKDYENDLRLMREEIMVYAKMYGLETSQLDDIYFSFKGIEYTKNGKKDEEIARLVALYTRLRDYSELSQKYTCLPQNIFKKDFNILQVDPRRTESRILFLLDKNNGDTLDKSEVFQDLLMSNMWFNYKYQEDIQKKLKKIETDEIAMGTVLNMIPITTDNAYDKYIEYALYAMYGDKQMASKIEKNRRQVAYLRALDKEAGDLSDTDIRSEDEIQGKEEAKAVYAKRPEDLLGEPVLPIDENYGKDSTGTTEPTKTKGKPNNIEPLDEDRIMKFLEQLKEIGFVCEGYVNSCSGTKALKEQYVRFYVLAKNSRRFLEPIGQVGNRRFELISGTSIEDLGKILIENGSTKLVEEGILKRTNHRRTDSQTYDYSATLTQLMNSVEVIEGIKRKRERTLTLSNAQAQGVELLSQDEIPHMSSYVLGLNKKLDEEIITPSRQMGQVAMCEQGEAKPILEEVSK